jgi:hypothetical protein
MKSVVQNGQFHRAAKTPVGFLLAKGADIGRVTGSKPRDGLR